MFTSNIVRNKDLIKLFTVLMLCFLLVLKGMFYKYTF